MQKKTRLIEKICIVILLIITILISTMPYKPKILANANSVNTMASLQINQKRSQITINKVDSKTNEGLEGVKFELQPIELDIIDEMQPIIKYKINYWNGDTNINSIQVNEGNSFSVMDYNVPYFEGWSITPDSKEVEYNVGETITPISDMDLYAVINAPTYTVTYLDGTPDSSVFGEKVYTGIKFGEKTPKFTGSLERDGYDFQGWAPAVCETVEYDMTYIATWLKRADLTVTISPRTLQANVGDTIQWLIEIRNTNWANAYNVKLESTLNNGEVIYTQENISINAGGKFEVTVDYVVTEEDAGKTLKNTARITDLGNSLGTARPITSSGSHSSGVDILPKEAVLDTVTSISQIPSLLSSFSNERMQITNQNTNNYTFIKSEDGSYKSNNQGKSNTEAQGEILIDLSGYEGEFVLNVNAAISCEENYDYAYAQLIMEQEDILDMSREFISITGVVEAQDYKINIEGGKKYKLLLGYCKDMSVDVEEDTFTINSVKIILNSAGNREKIELQTDNTGKIMSEVPNGRYILKEISTQPGYKVLEHPVVIDVINNQIKIIENLNTEDKITILENNELKIENTTCRVIAHYYIKNVDGEYTEEKIIEDKVLKGIEGENYKLDHEIYLEKEGTEYELEYERENGKLKYVVPENENGVLGKEDIHVKYYYQPKKKITINKIWEDNNNSLGIRPESIKVTLFATIENESGELVDYHINNTETVVELRALEGNENGDNWTYTWINLDTHDGAGRELMYYVDEIEVPESYYSVVSLIDYEHFNITNYKYGSIKIIKVDSNDNNIKLGGAEFKLEKILEKGEEQVIDEYFEPQIITTSTEEENLGEAVFEKLDYGKYRLTETKAPNGYSLQKKSIDIEITQESPDFVGEVINTEKTVFPDTGGNGSIILTMMGVFLIAIAIKIKK